MSQIESLRQSSVNYACGEMSFNCGTSLGSTIPNHEPRNYSGGQIYWPISASKG